MMEPDMGLNGMECGEVERKMERPLCHTFVPLPTKALAYSFNIWAGQLTMTTTHVLSLPFRKSTQLSLSRAIQQYISTKYDQHPDMFRHDLDTIDALRRDAINVREAHPSGIRKLQMYAAQLVWIGGKFPIDVGADFTWYPALGYHTEHPLVQNNLKYELMNVLYNLAALYSQLAVASNRNSTEGLKTAASWFSHAAGVLTHIKTQVLPELRMPSPPDDMDETTLESLIQLFLAEAQECYWQKAVMDGYKDASIAKLAARVSDLYNEAGEAAMRSEAISSAWIHHMSAKHHHFAAAAQFRAASDCLERKKYGEEIARLRDALACVNEGLKETRGGYLSKAVVEDLQGLKRRLEEDLKRAEIDNDRVYLHIVPPKTELKRLDRANMAVARVPPQVAKPYEFLGDHNAEFGPALFTKLVPFAVHVAVSIYEERRDRLVNNSIISELESMTSQLHEILSSLNLPGSLQALEKPLGLPGTLVQHADEIRQADALYRLQQGLTDIDKLCSSDLAIFEEGRSLLLAEEEEDSRLRLKYGTERWNRPQSRQDPSPNGGAKLWRQAQDIEGYFGSSTASDQVVREKFNAVRDTLAILAGSDRSIMDFIPNSRRTDIPESLKPALGRLRSAYNDVQRLESRRRKRVESLRARSRADDIKPDILVEAARLERAYPTTAIATAHFEDFFEKRLDRLYESELEAVERDKQEQEKIVQEVKRANKEFEAQKRQVDRAGGGNREREEALQKLDAAYYKYKEIVSNVEIVEQWRGLVRGSLEEEINMPPLSSLNMHQSSFSYQQQQQHHQQPPPPPPQIPFPEPIQPHQPIVEQAHIQSWADNVPQQQPKPVAPGAWAPNMGIKFGSPVAQGQQHQQEQGQPGPVNATWDPSQGIRAGRNGDRLAKVPTVRHWKCYEEEVVREVVTAASGKDKDKDNSNTYTIKVLVKKWKDCGSKSCPQSTSYQPHALASSSSSSSSSDTKK
ncbi:pH-response regulator protein palA/rim-20 [Neurospora hispaniola]|uniref:PH-response regulator protein palA/rim-20 n=1 Tax=Neurospora hispaniola TaxID=588809 RepID=A0AAJ0MN41_9PEZI|nr:pH-response regulator protein palA/rim-20 [Neurospora hispaniola]